MRSQSNLLLRTLLLFGFLYLLFILIGGTIIWGCYWLLMSYWTTGNRYEIPTIAIVIFFIGAILLIVKIIESLFAVQRVKRSVLMEVTREDEPTLFSLIDEVAEAVQITSPKQVYLLSSVSASVFFDAGFWNVFFPARKKLEIGVGLINVLNKEELRAVLAHELGHFSQKTTALGGPVYVIGQSVQYLITHVEVKKTTTMEDQCYTLLIIFRLVVELLFSKLSQEYALLMEELEYEADNIAVQVVDKKALISALLKVTFAAEWFDRTVKSLEILARYEKSIGGLYKSHHCMISAFLQAKGIQWDNDYIESSLPDCSPSLLSKKRIEKLRNIPDYPENRTGEMILSQTLLRNYVRLCSIFTRMTYKTRLRLNPDNLPAIEFSVYQQWMLKYIQTFEKKSIINDQLLDIEVVMKDHLHSYPWVDYYFDIYWNDKKIGKGYYKKGFSILIKAPLGKHQLEARGVYLKKASLPIDLLLPGRYKIHIGYKLHFWQAEYEFYVKNVELLCNV